MRGVAAIAIAVARHGPDRGVPGQLRRDPRRAVVRRHARRPPVLAGRDPLLDRRPGRDRDRRLADQQRRELLLLGHRRLRHRGDRDRPVPDRDAVGGDQSQTTRDLHGQPRARRGEDRRPRGDRVRRRLLGEPGARLPGRVPARDRAARVLDLGRGAHDLRPSRLRRRRERRGGPSRGHQRAEHPDDRLHDLRGDGRPRRRDLRLAAELGRPERRAAGRSCSTRSRRP